MAKRLLSALGLVYFTAWVALIIQQMNLVHKEVPCWFYNPALGESSFSEMITLVGYLIAIGQCWVQRKRYRSPVYILIAFMSLVLFLEECNYGQTIYRFFAGTQVPEGKSLHNLLEEKYTHGYWRWEDIAKTLLFVGYYFGTPIYFRFFQGRKDRWLTAVALTPAAIWGVYLVRHAQWESKYGVSMFPNHVCVSLDEEIEETLFPFSLVFLLLLDRYWPTLPKVKKKLQAAE